MPTAHGEPLAEMTECLSRDSTIHDPRRACKSVQGRVGPAPPPRALEAGLTTPGPAAGDFFGPFAAHRAEMDYTYHVNYVAARQVPAGRGPSADPAARLRAALLARVAGAAAARSMTAMRTAAQEREGRREGEEGTGVCVCVCVCV